MSLIECRRLATKIDQHMQQFAAQDVNDAHDRLAGFTAYALQLSDTWQLKVGRRGQHRPKDGNFKA